MYFHLVTFWVRKDGCGRERDRWKRFDPITELTKQANLVFNACRPIGQFVVSSESVLVLCRIATWEWLTLFLFLLASQARDWVKIHIPKQSHSSVRHEKDLRYKHKMTHEFLFHISSVPEHISVFG